MSPSPGRRRILQDDFEADSPPPGSPGQIQTIHADARFSKETQTSPSRRQLLRRDAEFSSTAPDSPERPRILQAGFGSAAPSPACPGRSKVLQDAADFSGTAQDSPRRIQLIQDAERFSSASPDSPRRLHLLHGGAEFSRTISKRTARRQVLQARSRPSTPTPGSPGKLKLLQGGASFSRPSEKRSVAENDYTFRVSDPYEQEVRRLAERIGSLVELSGRPLEDVALTVGLSPESLAAIFRGAERLEVSHLLRLAEALGVHPSEFFLLAFPRRSSRGSTQTLLEKAREALRVQSEDEAATPGGPGTRGRSGGGPGSPPPGGTPRGGKERP